MEQYQPNTSAQKPEEDFNLREVLIKYLIYWPWFIVSAVFCVVATYIYLRYTTPVYQISASLLIKEQDQHKGGAASPLAAIQDLGFMSMSNNFDNEVEVLKSRSLVKKVVTNLGLNITHTEVTPFSFNKPLYLNEPIRVSLPAEVADTLASAVKICMEYDANSGLDVELTYWKEREEYILEANFASLPAAMPTPLGVFTFTAGSAFTAEKPLSLEAQVVSLQACTDAYCLDMNITPTSKTTTIARIDVKNAVGKRGVDFINELVRVYNQDANDEKNEIALKSAEFIEDRIRKINVELGLTDSQLATFKQGARLTDLTGDAQIALQEDSRYKQKLTENSAQIAIVSDLQSYINDPANRDEVVPLNIGIEDQALNKVITDYNAMVIERKRLLRTATENNPAVINLNSSIEAMRVSVHASINSVLQGLRTTANSLASEANRYGNRISSAPKHEKEFMSIARQQEIQATLYTMLLEKREENALTLAATASNGRIVETPLASNLPVAPRKLVFLLAALLFGIAIPVGIIYVLDQLKYKIESKKDVKKLTTVPVIAEILKIKDKAKREIQVSTGRTAKDSILVREDKNDMMEETFRVLRTNAIFLLKEKENVIMFTSSQPGEGKSFIACNLAASFAFLGKKVIVVGLDIRKPGLNRVFGFSPRVKGITDHLVNAKDEKLENLIIHSEISDNLDILPGGTIPPNPTELVARTELDNTINYLKSIYDYVIIDTAPIAMVTDTQLISRVADLCVYVCRADVTPKTSYEFINTLQAENNFKHLATIINDIDPAKRKNRYGYGKKYGYGYGYGYGYEKGKKNKG